MNMTDAGDLAPTTGVGGGAPSIRGALTRTDPQSRRRHMRAHPLSQYADATRRGATCAHPLSQYADATHRGATCAHPLSQHADATHRGAPLRGGGASTWARDSQNGGASTSHPRRQKSDALPIPRRKPRT